MTLFEPDDNETKRHETKHLRKAHHFPQSPCSKTFPLTAVNRKPLATFGAPLKAGNVHWDSGERRFLFEPGQQHRQHHHHRRHLHLGHHRRSYLQHQETTAMHDYHLTVPHGRGCVTSSQASGVFSGKRDFISNVAISDKQKLVSHIVSNTRDLLKRQDDHILRRGKILMNHIIKQVNKQQLDHIVNHLQKEPGKKVLKNALYLIQREKLMNSTMRSVAKKTVSENSNSTVQFLEEKKSIVRQIVSKAQSLIKQANSKLLQEAVSLVHQVQNISRNLEVRRAKGTNNTYQNIMEDKTKLIKNILSRTQKLIKEEDENLLKEANFLIRKVIEQMYAYQHRDKEKYPVLLQQKGVSSGAVNLMLENKDFRTDARPKIPPVAIPLKNATKSDAHNREQVHSLQNQLANDFTTEMDEELEKIEKTYGAGPENKDLSNAKNTKTSNTQKSIKEIEKAIDDLQAHFNNFTNGLKSADFSKFSPMPRPNNGPASFAVDEHVAQGVLNEINNFTKEVDKYTEKENELLLNSGIKPKLATPSQILPLAKLDKNKSQSTTVKGHPVTPLMHAMRNRNKQLADLAKLKVQSKIAKKVGKESSKSSQKPLSIPLGVNHEIGKVVKNTSRATPTKQRNANAELTLKVSPKLRDTPVVLKNGTKWALVLSPITKKIKNISLDQGDAAITPRKPNVLVPHLHSTKVPNRKNEKKFPVAAKSSSSSMGMSTKIQQPVYSGAATAQQTVPSGSANTQQATPGVANDYQNTPTGVVNDYQTTPTGVANDYQTTPLVATNSPHPVINLPQNPSVPPCKKGDIHCLSAPTSTLINNVIGVTKKTKPSPKLAATQDTHNKTNGVQVLTSLHNKTRLVPPSNKTARLHALALFHNKTARLHTFALFHNKTTAGIHALTMLHKNNRLHALALLRNKTARVRLLPLSHDKIAKVHPLALPHNKSTGVHHLPSLQNKSVGVHSLPSLQNKSAGVHHLPFLHNKSAGVHSFPSLQNKSAGVHSLPSIQNKSAGVHSLPSLQNKSARVNTLPSLQNKSARVHSLPSLQNKSARVHSLPSLQSKSARVHSLPSLQNKSAGVLSLALSRDNTARIHQLALLYNKTAGVSSINSPHNTSKTRFVKCPKEDIRCKIVNSGVLLLHSIAAISTIKRKNQLNHLASNKSIVPAKTKHTTSRTTPRAIDSLCDTICQINRLQNHTRILSTDLKNMWSIASPQQPKGTRGYQRSIRFPGAPFFKYHQWSTALRKWSPIGRPVARGSPVNGKPLINGNKVISKGMIVVPNKTGFKGSTVTNKGNIMSNKPISKVNLLPQKPTAKGNMVINKQTMKGIAAINKLIPKSRNFATFNSMLIKPGIRVNMANGKMLLKGGNLNDKPITKGRIVGFKQVMGVKSMVKGSMMANRLIAKGNMVRRTKPIASPNKLPKMNPMTDKSKIGIIIPPTATSKQVVWNPHKPFAPHSESMVSSPKTSMIRSNKMDGLFQDPAKANPINVNLLVKANSALHSNDNDISKHVHRILWLHKPVTEMLSNLGIESGESKSVIPPSLKNAHMMNGLLQTGSEPLESTYEMKQMSDDKVQLDAANIMDELVSMMQNTASASGKLVSNINGSPGTHNEIYKNAINQSLEELQMAGTNTAYQGAYNQLYNEIDTNKNEYLNPSIKEIQMAQSTKLTPHKIDNIVLPDMNALAISHPPNAPQESGHSSKSKQPPDQIMMVRPIGKISENEIHEIKGNKVLKQVGRINNVHGMNHIVVNDKDRTQLHRGSQTDKHYEDKIEHYQDKGGHHENKAEHFGEREHHYPNKGEHYEDQAENFQGREHHFQDKGGHNEDTDEHFEDREEHYQGKGEHNEDRGRPYQNEEEHYRDKGEHYGDKERHNGDRGEHFMHRKKEEKGHTAEKQAEKEIMEKFDMEQDRHHHHQNEAEEKGEETMNNGEEEEGYGNNMQKSREHHRHKIDKAESPHEIKMSKNKDFYEHEIHKGIHKMKEDIENDGDRMSNEQFTNEENRDNHGHKMIDNPKEDEHETKEANDLHDEEEMVNREYFNNEMKENRRRYKSRMRGNRGQYHDDSMRAGKGYHRILLNRIKQGRVMYNSRVKADREHSRDRMREDKKYNGIVMSAGNELTQEQMEKNFYAHEIQRAQENNQPKINEIKFNQENESMKNELSHEIGYANNSIDNIISALSNVSTDDAKAREGSLNASTTNGTSKLDDGLNNENKSAPIQQGLVTNGTAIPFVVQHVYSPADGEADDPNNPEIKMGITLLNSENVKSDTFAPMLQHLSEGKGNKEKEIVYEDSKYSSKNGTVAKDVSNSLVNGISNDMSNGIDKGLNKGVKFYLLPPPEHSNMIKGSLANLLKHFNENRPHDTRFFPQQKVEGRGDDIRPLHDLIGPASRRFVKKIDWKKFLKDGDKSSLDKLVLLSKLNKAKHLHDLLDNTLISRFKGKHRKNFPMVLNKKKLTDLMLGSNFRKPGLGTKGNASAISFFKTTNKGLVKHFLEQYQQNIYNKYMTDIFNTAATPLLPSTEKTLLMSTDSYPTLMVAPENSQLVDNPVEEKPGLENSPQDPEELLDQYKSDQYKEQYKDPERERFKEKTKDMADAGTMMPYFNEYSYEKVYGPKMKKHKKASKKSNRKSKKLAHKTGTKSTPSTKEISHAKPEKTKKLKEEHSLLVEDDKIKHKKKGVETSHNNHHDAAEILLKHVNDITEVNERINATLSKLFAQGRGTPLKVENPDEPKETVDVYQGKSAESSTELKEKTGVSKEDTVASKEIIDVPKESVDVASKEKSLMSTLENAVVSKANISVPNKSNETSKENARVTEESGTSSMMDERSSKAKDNSTSPPAVPEGFPSLPMNKTLYPLIRFVNEKLSQMIPWIIPMNESLPSSVDKHSAKSVVENTANLVSSSNATDSSSRNNSDEIRDSNLTLSKNVPEDESKDNLLDDLDYNDVQLKSAEELKKEAQNTSETGKQTLSEIEKVLAKESKESEETDDVDNSLANATTTQYDEVLKGHINALANVNQQLKATLAAMDRKMTGYESEPLPAPASKKEETGGVGIRPHLLGVSQESKELLKQHVSALAEISKQLNETLAASDRANLTEKEVEEWKDQNALLGLSGGLLSPPATVDPGPDAKEILKKHRESFSEINDILNKTLQDLNENTESKIMNSTGLKSPPGNISSSSKLRESTIIQALANAAYKSEDERLREHFNTQEANRKQNETIAKHDIASVEHSSSDHKLAENVSDAKEANETEVVKFVPRHPDDHAEVPQNDSKSGYGNSLQRSKGNLDDYVEALKTVDKQIDTKLEQLKATPTIEVIRPSSLPETLAEYYRQKQQREDKEKQRGKHMQKQQKQHINPPAQPSLNKETIKKVSQKKITKEGYQKKKVTEIDGHIDIVPGNAHTAMSLGAHLGLTRPDAEDSEAEEATESAEPANRDIFSAGKEDTLFRPHDEASLNEVNKIINSSLADMISIDRYGPEQEMNLHVSKGKVKHAEGKDLPKDGDFQLREGRVEYTKGKQPQYLSLETYHHKPLEKPRDHKEKAQQEKLLDKSHEKKVVLNGNKIVVSPEFEGFDINKNNKTVTILNDKESSPATTGSNATTDTPIDSTLEKVRTVQAAFNQMMAQQATVKQMLTDMLTQNEALRKSVDLKNDQKFLHMMTAQENVKSDMAKMDMKPTRILSEEINHMSEKDNMANQLIMQLSGMNPTAASTINDLKANHTSSDILNAANITNELLRNATEYRRNMTRAINGRIQGLDEKFANMKNISIQSPDELEETLQKLQSFAEGMSEQQGSGDESSGVEENVQATEGPPPDENYSNTNATRAEDLVEVFRNISTSEGSGDGIETMSMDTLQQQMLQNSSVEMINTMTSENQTSENHNISSTSPSTKDNSTLATGEKLIKGSVPNDVNTEESPLTNPNDSSQLSEAGLSEQDYPEVVANGEAPDTETPQAAEGSGLEDTTSQQQQETREQETTPQNTSIKTLNETKNQTAQKLQIPPTETTTPTPAIAAMDTTEGSGENSEQNSVVQDTEGQAAVTEGEAQAADAAGEAQAAEAAGEAQVAEAAREAQPAEAVGEAQAPEAAGEAAEGMQGQKQGPSDKNKEETIPQEGSGDVSNEKVDQEEKKNNEEIKNVEENNNKNVSSTLLTPKQEEGNTPTPTNVNSAPKPQEEAIDQDMPSTTLTEALNYLTPPSTLQVLNQDEIETPTIANRTVDHEYKDAPHQISQNVKTHSKAAPSDRKIVSIAENKQEESSKQKHKESLKLKEGQIKANDQNTALQNANSNQREERKETFDANQLEQTSTEHALQPSENPDNAHSFDVKIQEKKPEIVNPLHPPLNDMKANHIVEDSNVELKPSNQDIRDKFDQEGKLKEALTKIMFNDLTGDDPQDEGKVKEGLSRLIQKNTASSTANENPVYSASMQHTKREQPETHDITVHESEEQVSLTSTAEKTDFGAQSDGKPDEIAGRNEEIANKHEEKELKDEAGKNGERSTQNIEKGGKHEEAVKIEDRKEKHVEKAMQNEEKDGKHDKKVAVEAGEKHIDQDKYASGSNANSNSRDEGSKTNGGIATLKKMDNDDDDDNLQSTSEGEKNDLPEHKNSGKTENDVIKNKGSNASVDKEMRNSSQNGSRDSFKDEKSFTKPAFHPQLSKEHPLAIDTTGATSEDLAIFNYLKKQIPLQLNPSENLNTRVITPSTGKIHQSNPLKDIGSLMNIIKTKFLVNPADAKTPGDGLADMNKQVIPNSSNAPGNSNSSMILRLDEESNSNKGNEDISKTKDDIHQDKTKENKSSTMVSNAKDDDLVTGDQLSAAFENMRKNLEDANRMNRENNQRPSSGKISVENQGPLNEKGSASSESDPSQEVSKEDLDIIMSMYKDLHPTKQDDKGVAPPSVETESSHLYGDEELPESVSNEDLNIILSAYESLRPNDKNRLDAFTYTSNKKNENEGQENALKRTIDILNYAIDSRKRPVRKTKELNRTVAYIVRSLLNHRLALNLASKRSSRNPMFGNEDGHQNRLITKNGRYLLNLQFTSDTDLENPKGGDRNTADSGHQLRANIKNNTELLNNTIQHIFTRVVDTVKNDFKNNTAVANTTLLNNTTNKIVGNTTNQISHPLEQISLNKTAEVQVANGTKREHTDPVDPYATIAGSLYVPLR